MLNVSELYIYPVKSLGGVKIQQAMLTDRGFEHDRRWMLVDRDNVFLSQREMPRMSLLKIDMQPGGFDVYHAAKPAERFFIAYESNQTERSVVRVWNDQCIAVNAGNYADAWFSDMLSVQCRLVFMPDDVKRLVDQRYAHNHEITSFSDDYPLLMIGQASLDDLNSRLREPLSMERFRPNIVFTGGYPFQEDDITAFQINGIQFSCAKPCARCVVTNIDQQNGIKGKEPLKTLSTYRMQNNKVLFGQNLLYKGNGIVATGDIIERT
ncbi:MOSC domain-containing protein [Panacibacter sp. DH6]|uniref:MOSC domain-containing protein n=2 Tax=Panacibacter microcysteis TaxID=2793269 RepID=A0A931GXU9_9BACT|nr:MOSC domain-containing protein [Panacibacter microcysteis]